MSEDSGLSINSLVVFACSLMLDSDWLPGGHQSFHWALGTLILTDFFECLFKKYFTKLVSYTLSRIFNQNKKVVLFIFVLFMI